MIAKRLIDRIAAEDVRLQCRYSVACHRKDGHEGRCASLGVVLLGKLAAWLGVAS